MSSSSSSPVFNTMSHAVAKKLTRDNFYLWKAQVWPAVRGAQLTTFLDGTKEIPEEYILIEKADKQREKVPNPEYTFDYVLGRCVSYPCKGKYERLLFSLVHSLVRYLVLLAMSCRLFFR
jgi:hypothetical protein